MVAHQYSLEVNSSSSARFPHFHVLGNYSMAPSSTLNVTSGSLRVEGCASFSGKLLVSPPSSSSPLRVAEFSCSSGRFDSVETATQNSQPSCQSVQAQPDYQPNQLLVAFTIVDNCSPTGPVFLSLVPLLDLP